MIVSMQLRNAYQRLFRLNRTARAEANSSKRTSRFDAPQREVEVFDRTSSLCFICRPMFPTARNCLDKIVQTEGGILTNRY